MSFVERCVRQGNGTCHLPIYFIYPSFASLKCLACHPLPGTIPPLSYTQSLHTYPVIPCKVFSSWNSKIIRIISAKESGDYFLKNDENKRRKSHSPKKSCKQGVWIKDQIPLSKCESIFLHPWTPHKIRIWLSSNPSWITIRLGNIGNQGMQHSSCPCTPHISLRGRQKRVKTPTPCEDHTPWVTREYHWETWISFGKSCKTPS